MKGRDAAATAAAIRRRCIEEGVLAEYMETLGGELVHMVEIMSEAEIQRKLIEDSKKEGIEEGIQAGVNAGEMRLVRNMLEAGLSADFIMNNAGVTPKILEMAMKKPKDAEPAATP